LEKRDYLLFPPEGTNPPRRRGRKDLFSYRKKGRERG